MNRLRTAIPVILGLLLVAPPAWGQDKEKPKVRFYPTPQEVVEKMLDLAKVTKKDVVYDLGCGDGRIVVTAGKKYGAKAVGVDIDPALVQQAQAKVKAAKVEDLVTIRKEDMFKTDLTGASVVTLYLNDKANLALMPILKKSLKPGSRVVSQTWDMGDWKPDRTIVVNGIDDKDGQKYEYTLYLWIIKAEEKQPECSSVEAGDVVETPNAYPESIRTPKDAAKATYKLLELAGRDGVNLAVHLWAPPKVAAATPVILFIHGIGMHGEPHAAIQAGFTARGLPFVAPDLRGHGRSGGVRGEMAEPHVVRADIGAFIGLCNQQFPDSPVVLLGESMGGLIAADYAWRGERRLAGLALLVPAFAVHKSQIKLDGLVKALSGKVVLADDAKLAPSTREPGFVKARKADKLALHDVKLSYLTALAAMQRDWPRAAAEVKTPLYIAVGGKDRILDSHVTREVFEQAGTPKAQKTWRQWDEAFHTLCWDPLTPQVIEDVAQWALGSGKNGKAP